jgi:excisionase family DNA binding protein
MTNPFETIETRLSTIENLLLDLKHQPMNKVESDPNQFLNIQEAAQFLNLAVPTIYSKVSRKELPFMKRSKRLYFSKTELMDYIKSGRIKTNDELADEAHKFVRNTRNRRTK